MNDLYSMYAVKTARKNVLKPKLDVDEEHILFVGTNNLRPYLGITAAAIDAKYQITNINNSFKAYRWLENYYQEYHKLPTAIICDLNFLEGDDYLFLSNIQGSKLLKLIPFILVSDEPARMDSMAALESGIDDFYAAPFSWENLEARIQFLKMFKIERSKLNMIQEEEYEQKVPSTKRVFDVIFAGMALIVLSPLLALIALLIKLESKGNVFYLSKRIGSGYKVFSFYKFRSMCNDADKQLNKLSHLNQYDDKKENTFVKLKNDPRVTRVGKFIRKTSLDELPQLLNVLFGDMSIVGNRPLPVYEAEKLTKDEWAQRFLAPAGITGLWQVTKRGKDNMSVRERMELDIEYANRFSLWYDLKIIFKTLPAMIQKEAV